MDRMILMAKRKIDASRIVADLEAGMGDIPVMEKYQISPSELMSILEGLKDTKISSRFKITDRIEALRSKAEVQNRVRPRSYLLYDLPIYEAHGSEIVGTVVDITEEGVQVAGIKASVNETRSFLIDSTRTVTLKTPLMFEAICRWAKQEGPDGLPEAGFEITNITPECSD
jgi:hypothetical protein